MLYLLLFFAGVLTIMLPCILPLLPIVVGVSIAGRSRLRPLFTVLGMVISFVTFTVLLLVVLKQFAFLATILRISTFYVLWLFGTHFVFHNKYIVAILSTIGALLFWSQGILAVIVAAGIGNVLSYIGPNIASKIQNIGASAQLQARQKLGADNPMTALIIGLTLGLVWVPCAGPALGFAFALVRDEPGIKAVLALLAYALGTAVPLLVVGYGGQWAVHSTRTLSQYSGKIKKGAGVVLLCTALALHFSLFEKLQIWLLSNTPFGSIGTQLEERFFGDTFTEAQDELYNTTSSNSSAPQVQNTLPILQLAPAWQPDGTWLNSTELTQKDLEGKVVLIDFWTYSCINCIRTLPYIQSYWQKYSTITDKFILIGVHAPEFAFEYETSNVEQAVQRHKLTYPIVQDNNFSVWRSYNNKYWPAKYLIDANGNIRYQHFGEGDYTETDEAIRTLLNEIGVSTTSDIVSENTQKRKIQSPEIYLGTRSVDHFANKNPLAKFSAAEYTAPSELPVHMYALDGTWQLDSTGEYQTVQSENGKIRIRFIGSEINLVMGSAQNTPRTGTVYVDNALHTTLEVNMKDAYELWRGEYGEHVLELELEKGTEVYAFTFGS